MTRVVLDTNVLISATISPNGAPRRIVEAWELEQFEVLTCPGLISEFERALSYTRVKLRFSEESARAVITAVRELPALFDDPLIVPDVIADADDNLLLALAADAEADYLVTGDKLLLAVGTYERTQILTPREFLEVLGL